MSERSREGVLTAAVCRYFARHYENIRRLVYREAIHSTWKRADILFVEGRQDRVHVIEVEPTFQRCFERKHGFAQVGRLRANYRWIAVPLQEFKLDPSAFRDARLDKGVGTLIIYRMRGRRGVREELQPTFVPGNFLHLYVEADDVWNG